MQEKRAMAAMQYEKGISAQENGLAPSQQSEYINGSLVHKASQE